MLIEHVRCLSETIGPRPSASPAELRAAEYVRDRLSGYGYEVSIEEFRALKTYSWLHFAHYAMFLAAWALYFRAPWAAAALSAFAFASYACETSGFGFLSLIFPKSPSRNAIGGRQPVKPARMKVIVSAHIDSSRSALFFHPRLVKGFRKTYVLTVVAMLATFAGAIIFAQGARPAWLWTAVGILDLNILGAALMLADRELRGRHTPGAVDNASGVAAMLGAAEQLAGERLRNVEVEFVGTGAEETGLFGMIHHLRKERDFHPQASLGVPHNERNRHDRSNTFVINIDHVGIGKLAATSREGMLKRKNCDARLLDIVKEFKLPSTGRHAPEHDFRTMLTDGYAALTRGFPAVSIMSFLEDGALANWHWRTDVAAPISEDNLQDAAALAVHIIRALDGSAA